MKTGLLLSNIKNNYMIKRFMEESEKRNVELFRQWEKHELSDFTINRMYLDKYVTLQEGKQVNKIIDGIFWHDKKRQLNLLNTYCDKPKYLIGKLEDYDRIANILGVPFLAKDSGSSKGQGVFLINNQEDFKKYSFCDLYCEIVWTSLGKDLRVMCIKGEPICVMHRENTHSFKSNIAQGGKGTKQVITKDIQNIVKTIYESTKLDVMGIDLLYGSTGFVFCELNVNPGFEELDNVCNSNIACNILDICLS